LRAISPRHQAGSVHARGPRAPGDISYLLWLIMGYLLV